MKSSSTPCANSAGQNDPSTVSMTSRSSTSKPARDLTLERIHPSAAFFAKSGTGTALPATKPSTISSMSWFRELNGESRTIPATLGSLFAYRRAVTVPMDWPRRPPGRRGRWIQRATTARRAHRAAQRDVLALARRRRRSRRRRP